LTKNLSTLSEVGSCSDRVDQKFINLVRSWLMF
jgi:hypothetical protein